MAKSSSKNTQSRNDKVRPFLFARLLFIHRPSIIYQAGACGSGKCRRHQDCGQCEAEHDACDDYYQKEPRRLASHRLQNSESQNGSPIAHPITAASSRGSCML